MVVQQSRNGERSRHALRPSPREIVESDAAADGLPMRWAWAAIALPLAGALFFGVVFVVHRMSFYTLQLEDHPVEWAQFALILFACLASVLAAVQFARSGRPGLAVLMALVALGCLGLAGEEISWGQRVFGLATPGELGGLNHQDEMNLHNIDVGVDAEDLFKIFEFVMGIVAIALALLARTARGRLHRTVWWWVAPPLFTLPGFAAIALYRVVMISLPREINPLTAFQEYTELTLYFSLACTAAAIYVRAVPGRYQIDLTGPAAALRIRRPVSLVPLWLIFAACVVVTVVFAVMTVRTGLVPGNAPGSNR